MRTTAARVDAWVPARRTLHLVDIENLLQRNPSEAVEGHWEAATSAYVAAADLGADDHVVVGCHPAFAFLARRFFPACRLLTRTRADGAELAILAAVDVDDVARRYHRVVIGSGDHLFAALAAALRTRGVNVQVIAGTGSLSWRLYVAGSRATLLAVAAS